MIALQKMVGWKYEGRVSRVAMLVVFATVARSGFVNPPESCLPPILSLPRLEVPSDRVSLHRAWLVFTQQVKLT